MDKYNYTIIEDWWRHNGIYDRMQASGIISNTTRKWTDADKQEYLQVTDDWWDGLTDEEKLDVYNEFFEEV